MTKEIHHQQSQPIYSAIIGLALLLGWILASQLFVINASIFEKTGHWFYQIYVLLFTNLVFWKLYTLMGFIFGIRAYIVAETESNQPLFYIRSLIWVFVAVVLSLFNTLSLSIIPLIVFGTMLFQMRRTSLTAQLVGIGILIFLILWVGYCRGIPNFQTSCFTGFSSSEPSLGILQLLKAQLQDPSNQVAWLFGFIVMIMGYSVSKAKWLLVYHFHYAGLRRLFFICIGLIAIWGILNYFNFYHFLLSSNIGSVFYMLDALTVQLLTVFIYLFILIYFENFRFGKLLLNILVQTGKLWVFNVFVLFILIFIGSNFQLLFSEGFSLIIGVFGFLTTSLLSYYMVPHLPKKAEFFY